MTNEEYLSTWKTYQAAWEDISSDERRSLLESSVAEDGVYTDPMNECGNREELIAVVEQFQQQSPGASFTNNIFLDHHAQAMANWTLSDADGSVITDGGSYARFGEDGKLTTIVGFF